MACLNLRVEKHFGWACLEARKWPWRDLNPRNTPQWVVPATHWTTRATRVTDQKFQIFFGIWKTFPEFRSAAVHFQIQIWNRTFQTFQRKSRMQLPKLATEFCLWISFPNFETKVCTNSTLIMVPCLFCLVSYSSVFILCLPAVQSVVTTDGVYHFILAAWVSQNYSLGELTCNSGKIKLRPKTRRK